MAAALSHIWPADTTDLPLPASSMTAGLGWGRKAVSNRPADIGSRHRQIPWGLCWSWMGPAWRVPETIRAYPRGETLVGKTGPEDQVGATERSPLLRSWRPSPELWPLWVDQFPRRLCLGHRPAWSGISGDEDMQFRDKTDIMNNITAIKVDSFKRSSYLICLICTSTLIIGSKIRAEIQT